MTGHSPFYSSDDTCSTPNIMECDICTRKHGSDIEFFCVACARSSVYATRLETAKVLLAKERLAGQVEKIVSHNAKTADEDGSQLLWRAEREKIQTLDAETRIEDTLEHTKVLREEMEQAKKEIAARRTQLAIRKADLETIKARVPDQQIQRQTQILETSRRGGLSFDALHDRSTETRAFLCREAAILMGLRQRKKMKGDKIVQQYYLGGLPIIDLKEVYNTRCTELNVVIAHVAHLLVLVAFYLSVRLPNEINLPQRDSPLPTVMKADDSYLASKQPHSNMSAAKAWNGSPSASRHDDVHGAARPRPLSLGSGERDERVAHVYNSDSGAFALFIEGVSLLALNVAWLCRSQDLHGGTQTWEDVCNIGENLWQLLLAPPTGAVADRISTTDGPRAPKRASRMSSEKSKPIQRLGQGSQASAHSFLGGPVSLQRDYRLPALAVMTKGLKTALHADIKNAEWELLHEDEWDDGTEQFDEAVHIKTRAMNGQGFDDARSIMTTRTRLGDDDRTTAVPEEADEIAKTARTSGTSGWTRVRGRDK